MRFLTTILIVLALVSPTEAGALKWLGRGAAACAMNSACSGAATRGLSKGSVKLGIYLAKRYGQRVVKKCLSSAECMRYATTAAGLSAGTAAGITAQESLESWITENSQETAETPDSSGPQVASGGAAPNPSDPHGDDEDDDKPILGKKLDFLFGKASGREHNIVRTGGMDRELQKIGLRDTPEIREMMRKKIIDTYNDPSSISKVDGKWVTREMFVMGPRGGVRIDTVWIENQLKSFVVKGGR